MAFQRDEPVNHCRPWIDVLFDCAAELYGDKVIGIVMTGANAEGRQGQKRIKAAGGLAIVQNVRHGRGGVHARGAIQATEVDHVLEQNEIGSFLTRCCADKRMDEKCLVLSLGH